MKIWAVISIKKQPGEGKNALLAYAETRVAKRPENSVVLDEGQPLVKGKWVPCGTKPLAVVFDIDETTLSNVRHIQANDYGYLPKVWDAWVAPGNAPPRATVQARLARPEWKIEVVATAAVA